MESSFRESIYQHLAQLGFRRTAQRDAIIEAVLQTQEHFHAEMLHAMAKQIEKSVSRATVYRTIPWLLKCGLLREVDLGKGITFYDPNFLAHPTHHHLICVDCDKVIEFEDTYLELLENCITRRLGFSPTNKALRIEGSCDELKLSGRCRKREGSQEGRGAAGHLMSDAVSVGKMVLKE